MRLSRACAALLCLAWFPAVATAALDPTDALQFQVNVGVMHDNNLFRIPDADPRIFGINPENKSDTSFTKGAGIKFDKSYSRQRVIAEANLNETTFDKNTNLDYSGYDGRLAWLWRVGNDWDGEASYRKRKTLGGFADQVFREKDLIETDYFRFLGSYQLDARWRLSAEFNREEQTHSAPGRRTLDADADTALFTAMYKTPADSAVGLQFQRTEREYVNFNVNNHRENRASLVASWRPTGLLKLDGYIGYVDVSHDQLTQRDFSGVAGRANALWEATGKVKVSAAAYRDIRLYQDVASSYIVADGIQISPVYTITSKVVMQGDFIYENHDFRGNPVVLLGVPQREDKVRVARIGIVYSPLRWMDLSLTYEAGDRKSNIFLNTISINSYDYQSWFAAAKILF